MRHEKARKLLTKMAGGNASSMRPVGTAKLQFRFIGTCDGIPVVSAGDCKRGLKIKKELGRGDVGVAYEIEPGDQAASINAAMSPNGNYVLKEVKIQSAAELEQFSNEICIGKYLGDIKVAPRIYDSWLCRPAGSTAQFPITGYYVMDKIAQIWENAFPSKSAKAKDNRPAPRDAEVKLVKALETMVKAGIIHQDCHPGNIGILADGRVILFDFGFSIWSKEQITLPETVLMSQLYIVLEQYNKDVMFESYLYDVIYDIRQNKYRIR